MPSLTNSKPSSSVNFARHAKQRQKEGFVKSLAIELLKDLDAIDNINYRPHPGQQPFHDSKARFRILAAGRRFGKTQAACYEAVQKAIVQPGAIVWIVAPIFG